MTVYSNTTNNYKKKRLQDEEDSSISIDHDIVIEIVSPEQLNVVIIV